MCTHIYIYTLKHVYMYIHIHIAVLYIYISTYVYIHIYSRPVSPSKGASSRPVRHGHLRFQVATEAQIVHGPAMGCLEIRGQRD